MGEVLPRVVAGEVWVGDRNFCVRRFLRGIEDRGACDRRVQLKTPTREGDDTVYLWSNLPATIDACTLANLYRQRWTVETAFQQLEHNLNSEIHTLAYPKAALFGFCVALVAYNTLAVLQAALRRVHGTETVDHEVSGYCRGGQRHLSRHDDRDSTARVGSLSPPPPWLRWPSC